MKRSLCSVVVLAATLVSGCGTPSVHPLATQSTQTTDPALVGTWAKPGAAKDEAVYIVAKSGDHYSLVVDDRDPSKPEKWEFELRVVQLGKYKFVDVQPTEADRKQLEDKWSSLVVPTHLFGRYAIEGDALKFWILNEDWLEKSLSGDKVRLAHTQIEHGWVLITAETPELQAFLKEHAEDVGAFELNEFTRVKP